MCFPSSFFLVKENVSSTHSFPFFKVIYIMLWMLTFLFFLRGIEASEFPRRGYTATTARSLGPTIKSISKAWLPPPPKMYPPSNTKMNQYFLIAVTESEGFTHEILAMAGWNEQTDWAIVSANDAVHICLSDVCDSSHVHLYHMHNPDANNQ